MRRGFTLVELLVVVAIIGILIGITLPAVQAVRGAAQKTSCGNNLHQIGLAIQSYASAWQRYPTGKVSFADPRFPGKTWMYDILPFLEQDNVWQLGDSEFKKGIPVSLQTAFQTPIPAYGCPSDSRSGSSQFSYGRYVALTSYLGVSGTNSEDRDGVLVAEVAIRPAEVVDGLSHTLIVGERPPGPDNWVGWWHGGFGADGFGAVDNLLGTVEYNEGTVSNYEDCPIGISQYRKGHFSEKCDVFHYWSPHAGGANFCLADGSVRFISYDAVSVMPALGTRAGRESVEFPD